MVNKTNVQTLINVLKNVPDKKIVMDGWFSKDGDEISPNSGGVELDLQHRCNTAACLAGWAIYLFATAEEKKDIQKDILHWYPSSLADKYLQLGFDGDGYWVDRYGRNSPYVDPDAYKRETLIDVTRQDVIDYLEKRLAEAE